MLSRNFVLTAAHCFDTCFSLACPWKSYSVRVGTTDVYDKNAPKIQVNRVFRHFKYEIKYGNVFDLQKERNYDYDAALLRLDDIESFPEVVQYAKLPSYTDEVQENELLVVTGWGETDNSERPETLLRTEIPVFNHQECTEFYALHTKVTDNMICAGSAVGSMGTNKGTSSILIIFGLMSFNVILGDSGGPVIRKEDGKLYGIVSFGSEKGPNGYTKVTAILDWIYEITNLPKGL